MFMTVIGGLVATSMILGAMTLISAGFMIMIPIATASVSEVIRLTNVAIAAIKVMKRGKRTIKSDLTLVRPFI